MQRSVGPNPSLARELLRHAEWTRRLARHLLADPTQAEDAVQDVWLAALRRPPRLDRPLAPWLRSVLHNRVLNRQRGDRRRQVRESGAPVASETASPEELLSRLQTQKLLVDLVCALAEPYRQAVVLRYFDGLSSSEIGSQLDLPAATVRGRLRTALAELREALARRSGGRQAWRIALARLAPDRDGPPGERAAPAPVTGIVASPGQLVAAALALATLAGAAAILLVAPGRAAPEPARTLSSSASMPRMHAVAVEPPAPETEAPAPEQPLDAPDTAGSPPSRLPAAVDDAVRGTVRLVGPVPAAPASQPPDDPFCARFPAQEREDVVLGREGGLANVVVRIASGWSGSARPPAGAVTFEQRACRYQPRVLVAQVGQTVAVENADVVVHEVRARIGGAQVLARSQARGAPAAELRVERAGDVLRFGGDGHAAMVAYAVVSESPFFAVTDQDGRFRLEGVPPGRYRLEAWHERLGTRQVEVTVPSAAMRELRIDLGEDPPPPIAVLPGRCAIAIEGKSPVALACQRDGIKEAKKVMKAMVAKAKKRGLRHGCDDCHRNDTDWSLFADARRRFEELLEPR
jgi:RNA polymerase sigma factor (sigma-70 family)